MKGKVIALLRRLGPGSDMGQLRWAYLDLCKNFENVNCNRRFKSRKCIGWKSIVDRCTLQNKTKVHLEARDVYL